MKTIALTFSILCIGLTACSSNTAKNDETEGATNAASTQQQKTKHITTTGKYGTVQEAHIKGVQTELSYSTKSGSSYNMVGTRNAGGHLDAARDSDELVIPTWSIGRW